MAAAVVVAAVVVVVVVAVAAMAGISWLYGIQFNNLVHSAEPRKSK